VFNAAPHARGGVAAGAGSQVVVGAAGCGVSARSGGGFVLDNGLVRVAVDEQGLVVSVYDIAAGRESLAPGQAGNLLQLHPTSRTCGTPGMSTSSTGTPSPT